MERTIRGLLVVWLGLLGGLLLSQSFSFPGRAHFSYWLMVGVAGGSPVVAVLLLWLMVLRLRAALHRIRVLRRAAKWRRPGRDQYSNEWLKQDR